MRLIFACPFILSASFGLGQDHAAKITFEHVAAPLGRILKDLSKQTDVSMAAGDPLSKDVLVVSVKNVPLQYLLDQIAFAETAKWEKEGSTLVLKRTRVEDGECASKNMTARIEDAKAMLEPKIREASALKPLNPSELALRLRALQNKFPNGYEDSGYTEASTPVLSELPEHRLAARLLAKVDPSALASVPDERKAVFANNPTPTQVPFASDVTPLLVDYAAEHEALALAYQKLTKPSDNARDHWGSLPNVAPLTGKPAKVLVTFSRRMMQPAEVEIKIADSDGRILAQDILSVGGIDKAFNDLMAKPKQKEEPIKLSPVSQKFVDFLNKAMKMNGGNLRVTDPELTEFLLHPEDHDPLELVASDAVLQYAHESGQSVVFQGEDMLLLVAGFAATQQVSATRLVEQMLPATDLAKTVREGVAVFSHRHAVETPNRQVDRELIGPLLRTAVQKKRLALADLAAYQSKTDAPFTQSFAPYYLLLLMPEQLTASGLSDFDAVDVLKLYGTLTDEQRKQAQTGKGLAFRTMTEEQLIIVSELVYGPGARFSFASPKPGANGAGSLLVEPTESMPAGLAMDGTLRLDAQSKDLVFASERNSQGGDEPAQPVTADSLAFTTAAKEFGRKEFGEYHNFRQGKSVDWMFNFDLTKDLALQQTLHDNDWDPDSPSLTLQQLPEAFRKAYDEALKRYRDLAKNHPDAFGPQPIVNPPPP